MKFTVNVYAVVRIPVQIEAETQLEACQKAQKQVVARDYLPAEDAPDSQVFDAEEHTGYHVDEEGDTDYRNSTSYSFDKNGEITRDVARSPE